ncbi:hypothetical protein L204_102278 [Cryptococcus depauperatus]|nr:hypothetical protein L204_06014 [Cryptococcus depauperatus CBS 7855]
MGTDKVSFATIPPVLGELAKQLEDSPWTLATNGDQVTSQNALEASKAVFDLGIALEPISHPHLHPFLLSILEPPSIDLRSRPKSQPKQEKLEQVIKPEEILPYTPLPFLTIDSLDAEQIWAQLELRAPSIIKALAQINENNPEDDLEGNPGSDDSDEDISIDEFKDMLRNAGHPVDEMDEEEIAALKDEMDDNIEDENMTLEEFKSMLKESGYEGVDEMTEEELQALKKEMEDGSSEDDESQTESDEEESISESEESKESEVEIGEDGDEIPHNSDLAPLEDDSDSQESASQGENTDVVMENSSGFVNDSTNRSKNRHPTLDDDFFSIDDFNRHTEELEAGRLSSGRLSGMEEEDEDNIDLGSIWLDDSGDNQEIGYADFFAPPRSSRSAKLAKPLLKKSNKIDRKSQKSTRFGRQMDLENEDEKDREIEDTSGRDVMGLVKGDLFGDEEEEESKEQMLSSHEKRQAAITEEIAQLESEAVGPKDWTLLGEASSRARPENSLLEENLDFESVAKIVPLITEESVKSIEEMIKQRILDSNFDSLIRVRAFEPIPFLPSRFFELQDTQSSKSLAQVYEDEYHAATTGIKAVDRRDEKLKKAHDDIESLWSEICYKLDALSSLNFVPKAPKAAITTISDLPTTSMESALPPSASTSTMLAPQELFAAASTSSLVARSELSPEQAQKLRSRNRKQKKTERKKLEEMAKLYGNARNKNDRKDKEEALKELVKNGKGVTVVGKTAKDGKQGMKRGDREDEPNSKRLKL